MAKRRNYGYNKKFVETINRNESVVGDSLEIMLERIKEGEGTDGITDRDLVYNSDETETVNPVTNIRSDAMELRLEEKMAEQGYKRSKMKVHKQEGKEVEPKEESTETPVDKTGE